jgi:4-carboxymuconolactone decarboxylase
MAKARIDPVKPGTRTELAEIEARIAKARGQISPLYQVLLNSSPIAQGWEAMLTAVRLDSKLDPAIRELTILRVAVLNRAPYEFEAHIPHALAGGLSQAAIDQLRTAAAPSALTELSPREREVVALADAMTRDIDVPDTVYDAVAAHFDAQGMVELVATIGAYNMVSRFLVALRVGH